MNYYQHHIGDFNNATRHLTRVERSLYRDLIELYYDTEKPLINDVGILARKVIATTDDEKTALNTILSEFFTSENDGFHNARCDIDIKKYHSNSIAKSKAGKASAAKRRKNSTDVKQVNNESSTNQEPITNNQEPIKTSGKNNFSIEDRGLAIHIHSKIKELNPKAKDPNIDKWANEVRLMRERDKRSHEEIINIFTWANNDPFWKTNILSPSKLRKQFDQLTIKSGGANNGAERQGQNNGLDNRSRSQKVSDKLREIGQRDIDQNGFTASLGDIDPQ